METPADVAHGRLAAAGTCSNIDPQTRKENIFWGIGGESCFEGPATLKTEDEPELFPLNGICQKPEVTDLLKPFRENMQQESANELLVGKSHLLAGITILVVTIPEENGIVRDLQDPCIGDRHTVGVAAKIIDGITKAVEGLFDVGTPVGIVKIVNKALPVHGMCRIRKGRRKHKFAGCAMLLKAGHELAAEHLRGGSYRDEETASAFAQFQIPCETGTGNDAVDMRMEREVLSPCMDHLDDARFSAQIPSVASQSQKCLRSRLMEQRIEQFLVGEEQRLEIMRHGENDVEVFRIKDFRTALIDPEFLQDRLAAGAVAVAAGGGVDLDMPALLADA